MGEVRKLKQVVDLSDVHIIELNALTRGVRLKLLVFNLLLYSVYQLWEVLKLLEDTHSVYICDDRVTFNFLNHFLFV